MVYQVYTFTQKQDDVDDDKKTWFHYPSKCHLRVSKLRWLIQSKSQWHSQNNFEIVITAFILESFSMVQEIHV